MITMKTKRLILIRKIMNFLPETRFFHIKNKLLRWAGVKIGKMSGFVPLFNFWEVAKLKSEMMSGLGTKS